MNLIFKLTLAAASVAVYAEETTKGYELVQDKATIPILNPTLKDRKVAKLRLNNGLQVYLLSDPEAEQSAASLSVEVGSWQDPKEYPGMAHFLEHMLFMGTAAYPKEEEYMQYIRDFGGNVNASTWPDRTLYMFSVNNEGFEGALDRFSHFFIDPLFSPSCVNRELHAVDQEHSKNIENDGNREYMVFKETGNPNHPNAVFCTGNAQTLAGIPQSALKKWYSEHYSANLMHLFVLSPLPLETLTELVVKDFSAVASRAVAKQALTMLMTSAKQKGHIIYMKPVKEIRTLSLSWELQQPYSHDLDKKAAQLVAYALGSEGPKSLLQTLKDEKIAEDLSASVNTFSKDGVLLTVDIQLTPDGLGKTDTAILRTYQALARLKEEGIPAYLFNEMQKVALAEYQYQSREDAFHFAMSSAYGLIDESLQTYPEKTAVPSTFDPAFVSALLQTLTPESCLIFVQADPKLTGVAPDTKEKWVGAEYAIRPVPPEKLESWSKVKSSPDLITVSPNPLIPDNLKLLPASTKMAEAAPLLLVNDESGKLYYKQDEQYLVPETAAVFHLKSPLIDGTAKSSALVDLFLKTLGEKLSSTLSFASRAGLHTRFGSQDLEITLATFGYSEKTPLLVKSLFQGVKSNQPTADQFELYKQSLLTDYENQSKELPLMQANRLLSNILYNDAPLGSEKAKALRALSYEEFTLFSKHLFETAFVKGLLYGNIDQNSAQLLWKEVKSTLAANPYPIAQQCNKEVLLLPEKLGPFMVNETTPMQGHGIVLALEEGAFSFEKRAAQQVLSKALQGDFFETLRTKQQTAYIAKSMDIEVERQLLQIFAVQSNSHHPRDLLARFELFLEDFSKNLSEKISHERFATLRNMLVTSLQMPPENLQLMAGRLDRLAFQYDGDFDWIEKQIKATQALTYADLENCASSSLARSNGRRLAILVEGTVPRENDFQYKVVSKEEIEDLGTHVAWKEGCTQPK